MKKIIVSLIIVFTMLNAFSIGEGFCNVVLDKSNGNASNGKAWYSKTLKGKVHLILYMNPGKRGEIQPLLNALNNLNVSGNLYSTVAIVNLADTWLPNAILESKLSQKQKELKNTIFVFDKTKYLVKKCGFRDEDSNIVIVDKNLKVIYQKNGKISDSDIEKILNIIKQNI